MSLRRRGPAAANSEAYDAFAYAYDQALGNRFFSAVKPLLRQLNEEYPAEEKTHLDIACGTGHVVRFFSDEGWTSVGVDASLPMLHVASSRARSLVAGDYRALPFRGSFARLTCLYDSLNHIKRHDELVTAFRSFAQLMNAGSRLFFDVNHPEIYDEVWGSTEPFVAEGPDYMLEMQTTYRRADGRARALVSGWAMLRGRKVKIREVREQRSWSEHELIEVLGDAGLELVEVINFDPYREAEHLGVSSVKMFFVCRLAQK